MRNGHGGKHGMEARNDSSWPGLRCDITSGDPRVSFELEVPSGHFAYVFTLLSCKRPKYRRTMYLHINGMHMYIYNIYIYIFCASVPVPEIVLKTYVFP